jgi:hypothetical protein
LGLPDRLDLPDLRIGRRRELSRRGRALPLQLLLPLPAVDAEQHQRDRNDEPEHRWIAEREHDDQHTGHERDRREIVRRRLRHGGSLAAPGEA